jgi:NAD(P)-dependent dehydrogenase (short-subunit alcohol dehydrogenase family)
MANLLDGRVVVVAGVGPGIGRDIALTMIEHGASVGLLARRQESLDAVADEIAVAGGRAAAVPCDITDPAACDAAVETVRSQLGPIDGLVCNASRINDGTTVLTAEPRFENWRPYFEVILFGSLTIARAAVSHMRDQGRGSIVMINSMVADSPHTGIGAYPAAKSALETASRMLAEDVGPLGIRVNGVYPGVTAGPTVDNVLIPKLARSTGRSNEQARASLEEQHPLRLLATGRDIGNAVAFLLSDLARAITGQALHVNAGGHFH